MTEQTPNPPPEELPPAELEDIGCRLLDVAHKMHKHYGPVVTANLLTALAVSYLQTTQSDWHVAKLFKRISVKLASKAPVAH